VSLSTHHNTDRIILLTVDTVSHSCAKRCNGWIVRIQVGNKYLDYQGNFAHQNCHNPHSPHYDPNMANNTYISIQSPLNFP